MANVIKYDGAPGTGKTWRLTEDFKTALNDGVLPENILFTQFRREAAHDAKNFVSSVCAIPEKRLNHVRTFHGECLSLLMKSGIVDVKNEGGYLMSRSDMKDFGKTYGYGAFMGNNKEGNKEHEKTEQLLTFYAYAKNNMIKPIDAARICKGKEIIPVSQKLEFYDNYEEYKKEKGKIDWSDMLNLVLENGIMTDCTVQMYDEAQDMTPIMYELSKMWSDDAETVFYAGDPLQTLYSFMGASPEHLMNTEGELVVLPVSHRLPANVWKKAAWMVTDRNKYRAPKIETPKPDGQMIVVDYKGLSTYLSKRFAKYFAPEETAFHLVRTNYHGHAIAKILAEMGTPFGGICGWTQDEIKLYHAIAKIKDGRTPTVAEYKKLIDHVKKTDLQYVGKKEDLKLFFENNMQNVNALNSWYLSAGFIQAVRAGNPGERLTNADSMLKLKINGMLKNNVAAIDESRINRIQILTIHGAKGLEATHVFLHAAVPPIVKKGTLTPEGRANEAYVWYVAITRTMKNLIVVSYPGKNYPIPRMCA